MHPRARPRHSPGGDPALDEIAARVSGDMVNVGIASIDAAWCSGELLEHQLAVYVGLASRASVRCTAGLWTLIAWIHWRTGNRRAAWAALDLVMDIDPDIDAAHYPAVFLHDWADPHQVPPVRLR